MKKLEKLRYFRLFSVTIIRYSFQLLLLWLKSVLSHLKLLYSPGPPGEKVLRTALICKMAASRFVEVTDKEIVEINSVAKKPRKTRVKILKQLFAEGEVFIREYSPRRRLGEYSPIITSPSANNC